VTLPHVPAVSAQACGATPVLPFNARFTGRNLDVDLTHYFQWAAQVFVFEGIFVTEFV
jgi:hypothetical protein